MSTKKWLFIGVFLAVCAAPSLHGAAPTPRSIIAEARDTLGSGGSAWARLSLMRGLAGHGDVSGTKQVAETFEHEHWDVRARALAIVGDAQARSGDVAGATKLAREIVTTRYYAKVLLTISDAYVRAGDLARARSVVREEIKPDSWIGALRSNSALDAHIARTLIEGNRRREALALAEAIADPFYRASALHLIAANDFDLGHRGDAIKTLRAAGKAARKIEAPHTPFVQLKSVAREFIRQGASAEARAILLQTREYMVESSNRGRVFQPRFLAEIAQLQDDAGDKRGASETLDLAKQLVFTSDTRSFAHRSGLLEIVRWQGLRGDLKGAKETISLMGLNASRAGAMAELAGATTLHGSPEDGMAIAKRIVSGVFPPQVNTDMYRELAIGAVGMALSIRSEHERALEVIGPIRGEHCNFPFHCFSHARSALGFVGVVAAHDGRVDIVQQVASDSRGPGWYSLTQAVRILASKGKLEEAVLIARQIRDRDARVNAFVEAAMSAGIGASERPKYPRPVSLY